MTKRILLDITTLARATGHADGIVRTLRELARFALANRPDVLFVLYDLDADAPRRVKDEWISQVINGLTKIDMSYFSDRSSPTQRFRERLPAPLKRMLLWIQRPRRQAYLKLERLRLRGGYLARFAERMLPKLLSAKYKRELELPNGTLSRLLPHDVALAEPPALTSDDTLVLAGSDWLAMYQQLAAAPEGIRPRTVVLCYDTIPLLFPQFFPAKNAEVFRACFHEVFPRADLVIFTAKQIIADAEAYCAREGLSLKKSGLVYLGADFDLVQQPAAAALPAGLSAGRYALFVSTIEPRKGHKLLFEVWKRLLAAGVPQQHDFKLVFVGRCGWMVDDLVAELDAHESAGVSLLRLSNVDDTALQQLYAQSAFCLYPSLYEGFGLPVIEAFRYGKAVIASSGGALLETVGGFSPSLDPRDEDVWYDTMKAWIENPASRAGFENAIRSEFKPRNWSDVARSFYDLIDRELAEPSEPKRSGGV